MSPKALEAVLSYSGYLPTSEPTHLEETETRKEVQRTSRKLHGRFLKALMYLANALLVIQEGWE